MSTPTTICRSNFKVRPQSLASAGNLADAISSTLVPEHRTREQLLLLLSLGFRQRQLPLAVPRWKRCAKVEESCAVTAGNFHVFTAANPGLSWVLHGQGGGCGSMG